MKLPRGSWNQSRTQPVDDWSLRPQSASCSFSRSNRTALALIQQQTHSGEALTGHVSSARLPFDQYSRERKLALEMVVNEEVERALLELEVAELAARWEEEEQLAKIVDGELTPWPEWPGEEA